MTREQELIIKKAGFLLYLDQRPNIEMLENEEAGILLKAIYSYANGLDIDETFDGNRALQQVFLTIKHSLIRDSRKYEERCKKASENALARWEKTKEENCSADFCGFVCYCHPWCRRCLFVPVPERK